jgi:hypothetical protein
MLDTGQVSRSELAEMEQYLGPNTLAKLTTVADDDLELEVDPYADFEEVAVLEDEDEEEYVEFAIGADDLVVADDEE